uniref:Cytosolic carboxypeptidase N-terminal domain-containing protein n=1 Tax=Pavo cristatus TaxID=9049 RepID=A0A8C9LFH1_PAVCR
LGGDLQVFPECSDIGGDEIIAGNVNKYTVLPAGYSGQPKKGHLVFDACFESGNLGRVDHITEFEYDLFIRPDTCNPRFRVWFNFTVENVKESQNNELAFQTGISIVSCNRREVACLCEPCGKRLSLNVKELDRKLLH